MATTSQNEAACELSITVCLTASSVKSENGQASGGSEQMGTTGTNQLLSFKAMNR